MQELMELQQTLENLEKASQGVAFLIDAFTCFCIVAGLVWIFAPLHMSVRLASEKGYSGGWAFFASLFLGWYAVFYYAGLPDAKTRERVEFLNQQVHEASVAQIQLAQMAHQHQTRQVP